MSDNKAVLDTRFKQLTEGRLEPLIIRLAVPTIISMLISSFYNMADTYFVGKINTSATAAVGVVYSLMTVIQAVGFGFGHGSGNFISRELGAGNRDTAATMASVGVFSSIIGGFCITLLGYIFMYPLARLLGATQTILPYAISYMKYILCGAPFMTAALTMNNQLRFQGNAFYAMIGITFGGILNVILDPIFIFVFNLGISGAAIATLISQFSSALLLMFWLNRKGIPISFKNFRPSRWYYRQIFNGGAPSLVRQGGGGIGVLCLNNVMHFYGDEAIAAMSIVNKIMQFALAAVLGYGQGFQPVCGFNYGAKKYDRVKKAFWFCVKSSFMVVLIISAFGILFAPQIIKEFRNDPHVIEIGIAALRWQCASFPLIGFVIFSNMMAQTIGKTYRAVFLALLRFSFYFVPAILILPKLFGMPGAIAAQSVSDILSFLTSIPITISILREMK